MDTKNAVLTSDIKHEELKKDFPVTYKATSSQRLNNLLSFPYVFCLIVKCLKGLNRTDDFDISVSLHVQLRTLTWSLVKCFHDSISFQTREKREQKFGGKSLFSGGSG